MSNTAQVFSTPARVDSMNFHVEDKLCLLDMEEKLRFYLRRRIISRALEIEKNP
jgi:hypothetical protein